MKHLLVAMTAFAMLSGAAAVPAVAVDNSISQLCADASTAHSRPGGFCDQVASNKSLAGTGGGRACDPYASPGDSHYCRNY